MGRIAFLSMDDLTGYVSDDALAHAPLRTRGWSVEEISWHAPADWGTFDAVVIRSTWDYPGDPDRFLAVLSGIAGSTRLFNDLPLVRWNLRKSYLVELAERGVPIPPTVRGDDLAAVEIPALFDELEAEELVLKPAVGANAERTFRLRRDTAAAVQEEARVALGGREFLAQPFLPAVVVEGEFSLCFFAGELSHAIVKIPRGGDFRVQEEHGGTILPVHPEPALLQAGRRVMDALPGSPLYARTDFVRDQGGVFRLMEVELIEPSLYLRMDPSAPERFAAAIHAFLRSR